MDHQIIDVNGVRVVRVNDLQLAPVRRRVSAGRRGHLDRGLLRRLGAAGCSSALGVQAHTQRPSPGKPSSRSSPARPGVKLKVSHEDLAKLHPSDIAEIISQLDQHHVQEVLETLDDEAAADTIGEVSPDLQVQLLEGMEPERAADILEEMDPDDAADILGDMEPEKAHDLLSRMEPDEAEDVRELLSYDEETAGGLMTNEVVTVPADRHRRAGDGLVRDPGRGDGKRLLRVRGRRQRGAAGRAVAARADRRRPGQAHRPRHAPRADPRSAGRHDEEVARLIAKYNLLALPIVDDVGHLRGIVTVDDAMDVILPDDWKARIPRVYARA